MKICCRCKIPKELEEFHNLKSSKDGKRHWCKECHKLEYQKDREENIDSHRLRARLYYKNNIDKVKLFHKNRHKLNPNIKKEANKKFNENNPHYANQYRIQRESKDPEFKLLRYLRGRLREALKKQNADKQIKTIALLGCSVKDFKLHLESLFVEGMSWNNHGEWHVDHKRPCASFDLTDIKQQQECFHYTNLQPLWAVDNLSKNSIYNGVLIRKNNRTNE